TAIIGAEEQMPQFGRLTRLGRMFGAPYVPVTLTPLPLPVRYHVWYGEPIPLHRDYAPADADDPQKVREAAGRVRDAVQRLIARGLAERKGIFR
ncbi:MAG: acyltransferase, partial [Myxococcales bacterium]